ncbi:MAG: hypothetical protein R3338_04540, partial [Thermoanaerobaculia bacterium]|nr:hypothetical protein [Thermoanaerobaculia bacterium]
TVSINLFVAKRLLHFRSIDLLRSFRTAAAGGVALVATGLVLKEMTENLAPAVALSLIIIGCAIAYGLTTFLLDRDLFRRILAVLPGSYGAGPGQASEEIR